MQILRSRLADLPLALLLMTHLGACSGSLEQPVRTGGETSAPTSGSTSTPTGSATSVPLGAIAILPRTASIVAGQTLAFQAAVTADPSGTVNWSIAERAAGGSITASGVYTPPPTAGTYHVVATSAVDPGQSSTATVTVTKAPPMGPQFYVATNGGDANPGTIDAPWQTIQKAMNSATPGSTVNIRAGTYHELLTMNVSGSPGNPITFQPYGFVGSPACGGYSGTACPGESVVLDYSTFGTITAQTPALYIAGRSNIAIQGLAFTNYSVDGPMHVGIEIDGGSHEIAFGWIRVENFRNVYPAGMDGTTMLAVARVGWGSTKADNVTFSDSQFYNSKTNMAEVLSWDLGSAGGVAERNHVRDCDGIAIHAYRGAHDLTFRHNLVEWAGVNRDGSLPYPDRADTGIGLYNDGGHDVLIEGNIVKNSGYGLESLAEDGGSGGGAQPPAYNVTIRDNVFVSNHYGMTIGTWYSSTDGSSVHDHAIYNNTFYGGNVGIYIRPFDAATVKVRNNIFAATGSAISNPLGWNIGTALDYNLYSGGGSGPDAHQVNADPMFASPAANDFRLLPGSPAIDAGDPTTIAQAAGDTDQSGLIRFVGARVDIGANEAH